MRAALWIALMACSREHAPAVTADRVDAAVVAKTAEPVPHPSVPPAGYCDDDKDCGYDDPCNARACVGRSEAGSNNCDKSAPPPGPCICATHACTLMRKVPSTGATKTGCASNGECAFIAQTGSCALGSAARLIDRRGGFCTCAGGMCTPEVVDLVACKTAADCSFLENPLRPAPAASVPRPFPPVVPCKTGGKDSVCAKGVCEIRIWKC